MNERRTTMIIGAGASAECGLPTSAGLRGLIANLLDIRFEYGSRQISGDFEICEAIRMIARGKTPPERDINPYLYSGWRIRDAMPQAVSIDNFIDSHQGDERLELCGKLAIVSAILKAENQSRLYFDPRGDERRPRFESISDTWYSPFFQLLVENCRVDRLEERLSSLTLIVFNYDRCVEQFLYFALQNYYGIKAEQAATLVGSLRIFHPYGYVGPLPWQKHKGGIEFGAEAHSRRLVELVSQIRTFTEGTDPSQSAIEAIRSSVANAQILLFLGFAYHPLNLQLLGSGTFVHADPQSIRYFGTAFGLSASDSAEIRNELALLGSTPVEQIKIRNELSCANLFREYWRSLSLAKFQG